MALKSIDAVTAYANTAANANKPGMDARDKEPKGNFAQLVQNATDATVDSLRQSEQIAMKSLTGEAELVDVVTAVTNAELTLQTVTAVRDRVVQAYQDILKMPI
ncbi:MAG: flagellar hook-basal body complex protein FliE [Alphaproteobacteria bacterium]